MNYLVMNGCPHKGNTWKLAEHVVSYIKKMDRKASFQEIQLAEINLPFCCGCSNCFRKGGKYCPHYEKLKVVYEAMERADGLILCSATYNMRETGLLKNLFDHFAYMMHRPHFFTKKALYLTSVGGVGAKGSVKSIVGSLRSIGYNYCYSYKVGTASYNAYVPKEKEIKKLEKVTEQFYRDVESKTMHHPKTEVLIPYNLFRGMCRYYAPGTEYPTKDGVYWLEPNRVKRAYDQAVPLHLYQHLLGKLFCFMGKTMGKRMIVTYKK
ncbi:flavodoxin family protein [Anaerosporobacter faecicola]|uniref:flavodoxin family protein n=1 Tax=Anaerosporobacter faecicola TaxID=2718714 RepID=UPI00143875E6|nr:NAD(P)H-dependent oxidoreductase [Anaerosporobacter faecicola]